MTVVIGERVERRVAALVLAADDDPVGVRLLDHRPVCIVLVGPVVDATQKQPGSHERGRGLSCRTSANVKRQR
jgi:hypothetical protein